MTSTNFPLQQQESSLGTSHAQLAHPQTSKFFEKDVWHNTETMAFHDMARDSGVNDQLPRPETAILKVH